MYKVFKVSGSGTLEQRILGLFEIKAENMYIHFQNAGWILINQQNSLMDFYTIVQKLNMHYLHYNCKTENKFHFIDNQTTLRNWTNFNKYNFVKYLIIHSSLLSRSSTFGIGSDHGLCFDPWMQGWNPLQDSMGLFFAISSRFLWCLFLSFLL